MFSQTVEYALRAMVQLASDAPAASTTKQIAAKTKVPGAYLAKVLQSMRRAGLIHSRRGVGGGISLARPVGKIRIAVVREPCRCIREHGALQALVEPLAKEIPQTAKPREAAVVHPRLPGDQPAGCRRRGHREP